MSRAHRAAIVSALHACRKDTDEAPRFAIANKNYRELKRLLRAWERASLDLIEDPKRRKS